MCILNLLTSIGITRLQYLSPSSRKNRQQEILRMFDQTTEPKLRTYTTRFFVALFFSLMGMTNALMYTTFSPLVTQMQSIYNLDLQTVTFGTMMISNIGYIPSLFVANYIIAKTNLRAGIIIGSVLTVLGLWIRIMASQGFVWIFLGQTSASLAQAFFYNTPAKISCVWFAESERTMATTVMVNILTLGNAVGPFLPQWFINENAENSEALSEMVNMFYYDAIWGSVLFVFVLIFFKSKPPTPPSNAATITRHNYCGSMAKLCKNGNYMLALVAQCILNANVVTMFMVLQPLVQPLGIGPNQAGDVITIGIGSSMIFSLLVGGVVTKTKKYKLWLMLFASISTIFLGASAFSASINLTWGILALPPFFMCIMNSLLPQVEEFLVEITYPVAEEAAAGFLLLGFQVLATCFGYVADGLMRDGTVEESLQVIWLLFGVNVLGCAIFAFTKEEFNRRHLENKKDPGLLQTEADN